MTVEVFYKVRYDYMEEPLTPWEKLVVAPTAHEALRKFVMWYCDGSHALDSQILLKVSVEQMECL